MAAQSHTVWSATPNFDLYYHVFGVPPNASEKEIKRAFHRISVSEHPDKLTGLTPAQHKAASDAFKEKTAIYSILKNPDTRIVYNEYGEEGLKEYQSVRFKDEFPPDGKAPGTYFIDWKRKQQELLEAAKKQAGGGSSDESIVINPCARQRTSGGGVRQTSSPDAGPNIYQELHMTLEEIYEGADKRVLVRRQKLNSERNATAEVAEEVVINVPIGVCDHAEVRVAGMGHEAVNKARAGDFIVVVRELPHAEFERVGDDLKLKLGIGAAAAVSRKARIRVPLLGGTRTTLEITDTVPPTDYTRTLKTRGMRRTGNTHLYGDLIITFRVIFPPDLATEEQRRAYYARHAAAAGAKSGETAKMEE